MRLEGVTGMVMIVLTLATCAVTDPKTYPPIEDVVERRRPARPGVKWVRLDGCRLEAEAPREAVSYQDGALVRQVYWGSEGGVPVAWVGKLRVTRGCGHPPSQIEVTYKDGSVGKVLVPVVPCGGY